MRKIFLFLILTLFVSAILFPAAASSSVDIPSVVFKGETIDLSKLNVNAKVSVDGIQLDSNKFKVEKTGKVIIKIETDGKTKEYTIHSIPGILTIIPPLIAIILAMVMKEVVSSLFLGIFAGSLLLNNFNIIKSFFRVIDKYIVGAIADTNRASIIIFTLMLGGMVGIITKMGGVKGIVESLSRKVRSAKSSQLYTWLMGIFIFFDDYTNTLIVGNTMRPLTDKWKVSREKLAYLVDSTAAPMASVAIISTWIGFEISLIDQSLKAYNVGFDAYALLLSSIPYRFYSILALFFIFVIFTTQKDFGPMYKAEKRAREGKLLGDKAVPLSDFEASGLNPSRYVKPKWFNGLIPILTVIVVTFIGLYVSGKSILSASGNSIAAKSFFGILFSKTGLKDLGTIISSADSFRVLLWSSLMGVLSAVFLGFIQKILKLKEAVTSMVQGMKSMFMAILILVLAWSLGVVIVKLHTADYLVSLLSSGFDHRLFPAVVFVLSAIISFSTGTSWGTISIMFPLVIPIIIGILAQSSDLKHFLILTISSVLAGSVFGDHCSPISDTTIMSSMASSCDHIDHVRTQLPYALTVAFIALLLGIIPVSFGIPYLISIGSSLLAVFIIFIILGKRVDSHTINLK